MINQFTELARSDRCMFIGNVAIGTQLTVDHLRNYYDAIVMVTAVISLMVFTHMWLLGLWCQRRQEVRCTWRGMYIVCFEHRSFDLSIYYFSCVSSYVCRRTWLEFTLLEHLLVGTMVCLRKRMYVLVTLCMHTSVCVCVCVVCVSCVLCVCVLSVCTCMRAHVSE